MAPSSFVEQYSARDVSSACLLDWLAAALPTCRNASLAMAVIILQLSSQLDRCRFILITPRILREHHFPRATAHRALLQLEQAGLITVRRCRGRSPLVSIVWSQNSLQSTAAE